MVRGILLLPRHYSQSLVPESCTTIWLAVPVISREAWAMSNSDPHDQGDKQIPSELQAFRGKEKGAPIMDAIKPEKEMGRNRRAQMGRGHWRAGGVCTICSLEGRWRRLHPRRWRTDTGGRRGPSRAAASWLKADSVHLRNMGEGGYHGLVGM